MKLNKTLAVALHRAMWTDMQTELGDNPSPNQRAGFKAAWINKYFPNELVVHNCFLCEYAFTSDIHSCRACPIVWPGGNCAGSNFSYATAPISDILALPEKGKRSTGLEAYDKIAAVRTYYGHREELLSRTSGLPGSISIEDHVKAIQEKAVEEYFEKTPGAKLASMDVDQAFKQYADEQKAPIFHALAEASGLSADNKYVKAHISAIREHAVRAVQEEAIEQMKLLKQMNDRFTKQDIEVKDCLAKASGLDRDKPVGDHIKEIYDDAFSDGRDYERERIMDKIGEMLNDKPAGETKNS